MKYILTTKKINQNSLRELPFNLSKVFEGECSIYCEDRELEIGADNFFGIIDGYIRDLDLESEAIIQHKANACKKLLKKWPLDENITGSFSVAIFDIISSKILICNDLIGVYPLYYLSKDGEVYISNSEIMIAFLSKCGIDEIGVAQRCIGPEYSTTGSRTILENCKRLLPGEYIQFDLKGNIIDKKYDNSLYQNLSTPNQNHNQEVNYWECFKKEIKYCLIESKEVNIALSGGLDSRLLLGAVSQEKKITCLNYGQEDYYETRIAHTLAMVQNAEFKSFSNLNLYFPPPEVLTKYTLETEAVNVCSWLEILENLEPKERHPFMLGDMTEAISARNIKKFSSRNFRQANFLKHYVFNKDYHFEKSSPENFIKWKTEKTNHLDRWYTEMRMSKLNLNSDRETLIKGLQEDLEELYLRIEAHQLPFVELFDELFSWYTHSRVPMSKQILICNRKFKSFCPPMSISILRMTSNLHPNLRLSNRFIKKLFSLKELKKLAAVPTSQTPFIPQNFPDILKYPVWGLRSRFDQYLIARLVRNKNLKSRYRLFKSLNWPLVYQNPDMENNLKEYFKDNHLGLDYFQALLHRSIERKNLNQWPFANTEMINVSSLNLELGIIKSFRGK